MEKLVPSKISGSKSRFIDYFFLHSCTFKEKDITIPKVTSCLARKLAILFTLILLSKALHTVVSFKSSAFTSSFVFPCTLRLLRKLFEFREYSSKDQLWVYCDFADQAKKEYQGNNDTIRACGNVWITQRNSDGGASIKMIPETPSEYKICDEHSFPASQIQRQRNGKRT